jgi:hypothetical protein
MSPERSLVQRGDPRNGEVDDGRRYVGDLENARETESSLRESVRRHGRQYGSGENHSLSEAAHEPKFFFMCGRCDMLVGENDRICQFCGAEFMTDEESLAHSDDGEVRPGADIVDTPLSRGSISSQQHTNAKRVDVLSMLSDGRSRLGVEHLAGGSSFAFSNYARVLEKIENIINEANDFGAETDEARRMLLAAWKACHEGKWNRAMRLADESRRILAPGVTHLIQGQISCLREAIIEMKRKGKIVTPLVIEIKTIQRALDDLKMDDAIMLTKALIAEIKQAQMHLIDNMESEPADEQEAFCGQGI